MNLDNFTACLNRYPALSAHPARRAGENAAERSRGWNGFRMRTGRHAEDEICRINHGIWTEMGKTGTTGGFSAACKSFWKIKQEISADMPACRQGKNAAASDAETWNQKQKRGEQMQTGTVHARYAEDKPKSCDYCYFKSPASGACELDACFYLLAETGLEPEKDGEGCTGCPYGRNRPCIGFCMQKLLMEMQMEKNREGGCAGAG